MKILEKIQRPEQVLHFGGARSQCVQSTMGGCNVHHIISPQNLYNISTCQEQGRSEGQQQNGTRSCKSQNSHFKKVRFVSKLRIPQNFVTEERCDPIFLTLFCDCMDNVLKMKEDWKQGDS